MTIGVWRIATDTATYTADDARGIGAKTTGGRWNRVGTPMVYTSMTIALACLETVVHFHLPSLPMNRYLVRFDVPLGVWKKAQRLALDATTVGWDAEPVGMVSLDIGQRWLDSLDSALLLVPSVIIPEEYNVLINPAHRDAAKIAPKKIRRFLYDTRLV